MRSGFSGIAEINENEYVDRLGLQSIINGFRGATAGEQLLDGMAQAARTLGKYTKQLSYNKLAAEEVFYTVELWQNANGKLLNDYVRSGASTVPEQLALGMGADRAQQYLIASFSEAASGCSAWKGGAVVRSVNTGGSFTRAEAERDVRTRSVIFATIIKLDRDGALEKIFSAPPHQGQSGLGVPFLALIPAAGYWAITAIGVSIIAAFVITYTLNRRIEAQNDNLAKLCELDRQRCADILAEIAKAQSEGALDATIGGALNKVLVIGAVGMIGYGALVFGVPAIKELREKNKAGAA